MVKFKIFLLLLCTSFLLSFVYFQKAALACELVGISHFNEVSPDVFIDQSLTPAQQVHLLQDIQRAVNRVTEVYGVPIATPRIIASEDAQYKTLGFNPTGMQTSGFFKECVFIGPKGLNTDVIAHELVHAEVRFRTNLWAELTQLPAWFIEGTGIQVDYREPFLQENIAVSSDDIAHIKSVFYLSDFPNTSVKYYQASLQAVKPMNPKYLYTGLQRINDGEPFATVFEDIN